MPCKSFKSIVANISSFKQNSSSFTNNSEVVAERFSALVHCHSIKILIQSFSEVMLSVTKNQSIFLLILG